MLSCTQKGEKMKKKEKEFNIEDFEKCRDIYSEIMDAFREDCGRLFDLLMFVSDSGTLLGCSRAYMESVDPLQHCRCLASDLVDEARALIADVVFGSLYNESTFETWVHILHHEGDKK